MLAHWLRIHGIEQNMQQQDEMLMKKTYEIFFLKKGQYLI